jgi:hypothetical protein
VAWLLNKFKELHLMRDKYNLGERLLNESDFLLGLVSSLSAKLMLQSLRRQVGYGRQRDGNRYAGSVF